MSAYGTDWETGEPLKDGPCGCWRPGALTADACDPHPQCRGCGEMVMIYRDAWHHNGHHWHSECAAEQQAQDRREAAERAG